MSRPQASLLRFVARRLFSIIPVLAVIAVTTFALSRLAPGNPANLMLGEGATEEQIAHLTEQWGFDEPVLVQLGLWLGNVVRGDLGESIRFGGSVSSVVLEHIGPTLSLALLAMIIVVGLGIPFGLIAGRYRGSRLDRLLMGATFVGMSLPEFWVAMLLVLGFSVHLGWFPVSGYVWPSESLTGWLAAIILPAIALSIDQLALVARLVRDSVIGTSSQPWVTSLRARGLSEVSVVGKHQFKSAAVTAITVLGNSFAGLLTAAVVVEMVFNIPGFGWLTVQAALQRDYPLLQGAVLLAATAYVLVNLLVDALYAVIDPRIRARGA
ncbi:MAG: ABC transporter permease [Propionibacteriaceae bacterium]